MRARLTGLALLAAALGLHVLVTVPRQRQAGADGEEYRRLREQRRTVQSHLARMERAEALRGQAAAVLAAGGADGVVRGVRRSVIRSLEGCAVSNVRLAVRPGARDVAASVSLSAEGPFAEAVRLASRVAQPGTGLLLREVTLTSGPSVRLAVDAVGVRSGT